MVRMTMLHSSYWEEKAAGMKKVREDYQNMQRRLNIATKRIEMMSAEEERIKHVKRLNNWEHLFCKVMAARSHGRRWKYRIEPLKKKLRQQGFNPYLSDSSSGESGGEEGLEQLSPVEGFDGELKSSSSGSDDEYSETPTHRRHSANQKKTRFKVRFGGGDEDDGIPEKTPSPITLPVDAATSTDDLEYDNYLLIQLYRPSGLLRGKDICCSLSYGEQYYSSEVFPGKTEAGTLLSSQSFLFKLSDDAARTLPPSCEEPVSSMDVPKLTIAVFPRHVAEDMAAHVSLPLNELKLTESASVIVPPDTTYEEFDFKWEDIGCSVNAFPVEYTLTTRRDELDTPLLPMVCHRIKVQRHRCMHSATDAKPWKDLLLELGYKLIPDTQSRAVSVIYLDDGLMGVDMEEGAADEEEESRLTQEQLAELTMKHAEEMTKLQKEYEGRLESLSKTLKRVRAESSQEIEALEQALQEAEKQRGKKARSITEMRNILARKKQKITHGLPEWGKDLPQDFFERLEVFAYDSVKKQEELTERIKREVSEACEKQLATQHRLAPGHRKDIDTTTEDVTLPALFMPTSCTKNLVYTPRAHRYFHPPGSNETRITQPPSVFKLPTLHTGNMGTLNLFELSQHFSRVGPQWLKEHQFQSPRFTPAPPPSACGFYQQPPRVNSTSSTNNIHGVSIQANNPLDLGNDGGE